MKMLSIQWLRFAACFGVVIFHASSHYGVSFDVGQAGVDIFFVISGLIMWTITERPVGAGQFLTQRLVRIAPMYWMVTGLMAVAALVHLFPRLYLTWPHLIASMLFVPWRSPSNGQLWPVLVPGWTLNYEIMFYILVASTLHLHRQLQLLTLIGILFFAVLAGHYLPPSSNVLNFYTNPIVLEFGFGLVIGWLKAQDLLPNFRSSVIIAILGLAFFACEAIFCLTSGIGLGRPLLFGIPSSMLVMGLVGIEKAGIKFKSDALTYAGNASYSIYLFHTPALSVLLKLAPLSLGFCAVLPVSLAAAATGLCAYRFIEKPFLLRFAASRTRSANTIGATS